jgi:hypothetical protein
LQVLGTHMLVTRQVELIRSIAQDREAYPSPDWVKKANEWGLGASLFSSEVRDGGDVIPQILRLRFK